MNLIKPLLGTLLLAGASALAAPPAGPTAFAYTWRPVAIGGGGFVDGIAFHPTAQGLAYARTDMGGAYRRDTATGPWTPLLDHIPLADVNLMGVESLAVDPNDASAIYLACGTYTAASVPNGAVLRSSDRGRTWKRTDLPFKLGGNEGGRGNGERLAVDPNDGRVLYLGSRFAGLWRSRDAARTFQRVNTLPDSAWQRNETDGPLPSWGGSDGKATINFVLMDPRSSMRGQPSRTIYAGVSVVGRPSLWVSRDGGDHWQAVPGSPANHRPMRAALASDGRMYIAYASEPGPHRMTDGSVWRYNPKTGAWTDTTPLRPSPQQPFGYAAVAVDAANPDRLLASTAGRGAGDELFRSTDGGATWKPLLTVARFDATAAPYVADTPVHWLYDVKINPANPDHALFTTGYGGWETLDLTRADAGEPTHWQVMATGIEETVALALHSPTQGVPLVTAIGDYSGFVHTDLDHPAPGSPKPPFFGNTHDVTGAELAPQVMVRIGHPRDGGKNLGYSLDGGASWREPKTVPDAKASDGFLAVSADGKAWIWTPRSTGGGTPHVSHDRGDSWVAVKGLPTGTRVVADRVNPRRFHAMALFDDRLYTSSDAGLTFSGRPLGLPDGPVTRSAPSSHNHSNRGDDRGGQDRLYATPGKEGDLWLAAFHGLYRQPGGEGQAFQRLASVSEIHAFGFGRAALGATEPTIYLVGTVSGRYGLFRSTDAAATWQRINDDAHQWGLILQVSGDPKVFGRVYVGTHGRGVLYGEPVVTP